jgi:hypothetical protein
MKRFESFLAGMIAAGLICMLIYGLTSCSGPKYGCGHGHPKQTWNRMVNRINSPY